MTLLQELAMLSSLLGAAPGRLIQYGTVQPELDRFQSSLLRGGSVRRKGSVGPGPRARSIGVLKLKATPESSARRHVSLTSHVT